MRQSAKTENNKLFKQYSLENYNRCGTSFVAMPIEKKVVDAIRNKNLII